MNQDFDSRVFLIDFFHDFMEFLKLVSQRPMKRTATGNLALSEIAELSKLFRDGHQLIWLDEQMGWKVRNETDCQYLYQIRVLAETMYLIYKRKGEFRLSKHGKGYLTNITSDIQFEQMVLWYWNRVNWSYFSARSTADIFQKNQRQIWDGLLRKGAEWVEFKSFCQAIKLGFHLENLHHFPGSNTDSDLALDLRHDLIERNLKLFGLVETEVLGGKKNWQQEIVRFRSTELGRWMYQAGLKDF